MSRSCITLEHPKGFEQLDKENLSYCGYFGRSEKGNLVVHSTCCRVVRHQVAMEKSPPLVKNVFHLKWATAATCCYSIAAKVGSTYNKLQGETIGLIAFGTSALSVVPDWYFSVKMCLRKVTDSEHALVQVSCSRLVILRWRVYIFDTQVGWLNLSKNTCCDGKNKEPMVIYGK